MGALVADHRARAPLVAPAAHHELLLRAALLSGEAGREAYREWSAAVRIESLDPASQRLLPRLYAHRGELGDRDSQLEILKRSYLDTWIHNQKRCTQLSPILRRLNDANVDYAVLKGPALAALYYGDWAQRPMVDVDLWVQDAQLDTAISILHELGFESLSAAPRSSLRTNHATPFRNADGLEIDLHLHLLLQCCQREADDEAWGARVPAEIAGERVSVLGVTDQFLHVCLHGGLGSVYYHPVANLQWVVDAMVILRRRGREIDWSRLARTAEARRLASSLAEILRYLRESFAAPIPPSVLKRLESVGVSRVERIERFTLRVHNPEARRLVNFFTRYLRIREEPDFRNPILGGARFLRDTWALNHTWQVPGAAAVRAWRLLARQSRRRRSSPSKSSSKRAADATV